MSCNSDGPNSIVVTKFLNDTYVDEDSPALSYVVGTFMVDLYAGYVHKIVDGLYVESYSFDPDLIWQDRDWPPDDKMSTFDAGETDTEYWFGLVTAHASSFPYLTYDRPITVIFFAINKETGALRRRTGFSISYSQYGFVERDVIIYDIPGQGYYDVDNISPTQVADGYTFYETYTNHDPFAIYNPCSKQVTVTVPYCEVSYYTFAQQQLVLSSFQWDPETEEVGYPENTRIVPVTEGGPTEDDPGHMMGAPPVLIDEDPVFGEQHAAVTSSPIYAFNPKNYEDNYPLIGANSFPQRTDYSGKHRSIAIDVEPVYDITISGIRINFDANVSSTGTNQRVVVYDSGWNEISSSAGENGEILTLPSGWSDNSAFRTYNLQSEITLLSGQTYYLAFEMDTGSFEPNHGENIIDAQAEDRVPNSFYVADTAPSGASISNGTYRQNWTFSSTRFFHIVGVGDGTFYGKMDGTFLSVFDNTTHKYIEVDIQPSYMGSACIHSLGRGEFLLVTHRVPTEEWYLGHYRWDRDTETISLLAERKFDGADYTRPPEEGWFAGLSEYFWGNFSYLAVIFGSDKKGHILIQLPGDGDMHYPGLVHIGAHRYKKIPWSFNDNGVLVVGKTETLSAAFGIPETGDDYDFKSKISNLQLLEGYRYPFFHRSFQYRANEAGTDLVSNTEYYMASFDTDIDFHLTPISDQISFEGDEYTLAGPPNNFAQYPGDKLTALDPTAEILYTISTSSGSVDDTLDVSNAVNNPMTFSALQGTTIRAHAYHPTLASLWVATDQDSASTTVDYLLKMTPDGYVSDEDIKTPHTGARSVVFDATESYTDLWVGTTESKLYKISDNGTILEDFAVPEPIVDLAFASDNHIWATGASTIYKYSRVDGSTLGSYSAPGGSSGGGIALDRESGNLFYLDQANQNLYELDESNPANTINGPMLVAGGAASIKTLSFKQRRIN